MLTGKKYTAASNILKKLKNSSSVLVCFVLLSFC